MKVQLTRPLHDASGDSIPAGTVLDREDGLHLIDLGGAIAVPEDSATPARSAAKTAKPRSE